MDEEWWSEALVAVFDHYGLGTVPSGERSIRCPVHDDSHASASANGAKGVWHCHACGGSGNAAHIVAHRESIDYRQAMKMVEDLMGGKQMKKTNVPSRTRKSGNRWIPPRLRNA